MRKNKPVSTIHDVNKFFFSKVKEETNLQEYLGPDGLKLDDVHAKYLQKCQEFKSKAKKYFDDNACLQKSFLHKNLLGYETSDDIDKEIWEERSQNMELYVKSYRQIVFDENSELMYEAPEAKTKRIRIIRDIQEERHIDFSENVDEEKQAWFTRHQLLSKFIQVARSIIIKNRLEKRLKKLKILTPDAVKELKEEEEETEKTI